MFTLDEFSRANLLTFLKPTETAANLLDRVYSEPQQSGTLSAILSLAHVVTQVRARMPHTPGTESLLSLQA